MDHRIGPQRRTGRAPGQRLDMRARHVLHRHPKVEDRGGCVFRSVDPAVNPQHLLCGWNADVVDPAGTENIEPRPVLCAGERRDPRAPRTSMKVQHQRGIKPPDVADRRRQHLVNFRISFENTREALLGHHSDRQIRPGLFQQMNGGGGEHAIAQRAQPDDNNAAAWGKSVEGVGLNGQAERLLVGSTHR